MGCLNMDRRGFLKSSAAVAAGLTVFGTSSGESAEPNVAALRKSIQLRMLPKELSFAENCALARRCGFEGMEVDRSDLLNISQAEEMGKIARNAGVPIHSVVFGWAKFAEADTKAAAESIEQMTRTINAAKAAGAGAVLLVPAIVTEEIGYADAYRRSQECIRRLIPAAKEAQVVIAVENVWNKFLLSPLEFARYVDEFESKWVRAYFDVGNVIIHGFAQDWIRTLGTRIVRIHLKDFKRRGYQWKNLRQGDVNWKEVMRALTETGYRGFLTTELDPGYERYLKDLSRRIDLIIAGQ